LSHLLGDDEDEELDEEELDEEESDEEADDKDEESLAPAGRVDGDGSDWGLGVNGKTVWVPGAI